MSTGNSLEAVESEEDSWAARGAFSRHRIVCCVSRSMSVSRGHTPGANTRAVARNSQADLRVSSFDSSGLISATPSISNSVSLRRSVRDVPSLLEMWYSITTWQP
jgi:hypothetical protein